MGIPAPVSAMVEAFLDDIDSAELRDVPALRAMLCATPGDTGPVLAPLLLAVQPRAAAMVDGLAPSRWETISLLGDLVERAPELGDQAVLAGLQRFALGMRRLLQAPSPAG